MRSYSLSDASVMVVLLNWLWCHVRIDDHSWENRIDPKKQCFPTMHTCMCVIISIQQYQVSLASLDCAFLCIPWSDPQKQESKSPLHLCEASQCQLQLLWPSLNALPSQALVSLYTCMKSKVKNPAPIVLQISLCHPQAVSSVLVCCRGSCRVCNACLSALQNEVIE